MTVAHVNGEELRLSVEDLERTLVWVFKWLLCSIDANKNMSAGVKVGADEGRAVLNVSWCTWAKLSEMLSETVSIVCKILGTRGHIR